MHFWGKFVVFIENWQFIEDQAIDANSPEKMLSDLEEAILNGDITISEAYQYLLDNQRKQR